MIFGINTTSDISKFSCVVLRAVRQVKFETSGIYAKYHYKSCYYLFILLPANVLSFSHVGISN